MIIDTHTHLDHKMFYEDVDEVIARAKEAGVVKMVIPGADPADLPRAVELSEKYEEIFFAVGVHPYDMDNYDREYLKKFISHPKCVAVGECGLDYYRLPEDPTAKEENKKKQKEVFIDQITLAKEFDLPLIVHIREASQDAHDLLHAHAGKKGGVLHCYNASPLLLDLKERFYYGIGGVLTFKNAKKLVEIIPKIPFDRIVLETDAPYLTPHPFRGKRNEPAYTKFVAQKLAEILGKSYEEICDITTKNAMRLFDFAGKG
ncbi:TatD DNase family protein [Nitratiruptor sp. YY08-26]|uniref:TatD family hydrolase n=1 Tax=unclassified Nitratiruptor TaxID=2624044 RepID=UPI0019169C68|nr:MULTISPECIES: TatD family hydrolase [unclassified Nitratiruptor]BCD62127.1 TatD DNase family protein [Nitratiruptor sp. YY08-13]BCD66063.1 TatD DNase family protein [Nitratiruptor sp. YY08-26]